MDEDEGGQAFRSLVFTMGAQNLRILAGVARPSTTAHRR
jgi:hypothetical protein